MVEIKSFEDRKKELVELGKKNNNIPHNLPEATGS